MFTRPIGKLWRSTTVLSLALMASAAMAAPARADFVISTAATRNVNCYNDECAATAPNAVMNVKQLRRMLTAHAHVNLEAGGVQKDIVVNAPMSWNSATLSLSALRSVVVNSPIAVTGHGGLQVSTIGGELQFAPGASVTFWDLQSKLAINNFNYTLVPDIQTLASLVAANPAGYYALAKD